MLAELKLEFETLTPLFIGDWEQQAELRPPSLKGLLRFWYRAIDPNFLEPFGKGSMTREMVLFGGAGEEAGQCPFLLQVESSDPRPWSWDRNSVIRFNQGHGKDTRNGLVYLGYPFQLHGNEGRTAIPPNHRFTVRCIVPKQGSVPEVRRAIVATFWLLGHLGGAGTRARRGFGSLELRSWSPARGDWPELKELPLLAQVSGPRQWTVEFPRAVAALQSWFGEFAAGAKPAPTQPHLPRNPRVILLNQSFPRTQWDAALAHMGRQLQEFRLRAAPDYQDVKDHLTGGRPLQYSPNRTSFGLPLAFRYSSARGNANLAPYDEDGKSTHERHGSLLHLRLAAIQDKLYPLFVRLEGAVPGQNPPAALRSHGRPLRAFRENAMDQFLAKLTGRQ